MSKAVNDHRGLSRCARPACRRRARAAARRLRQRHTRTTPSNQRDAAAYNVQLGIAYMNQGDLAACQGQARPRARRRTRTTPTCTARARMLFERMGDSQEGGRGVSYARCAWRRTTRKVHEQLRGLPVPERAHRRGREALPRRRRTTRSTPRRRRPTRTPACACAPPSVTTRRAPTSCRRLQLQAEFRGSGVPARRAAVPARRARRGAQPASTASLGNFARRRTCCCSAVRVARAQGDRLAAQRYARKLQLDFPEHRPDARAGRARPQPRLKCMTSASSRPTSAASARGCARRANARA